MKFFKMLLLVFLVLGIAACSIGSLPEPSPQELEASFLDRLKEKTLVYADGTYFGQFNKTGAGFWRNSYRPIPVWHFMEMDSSFGRITPNTGIYIATGGQGGLDYIEWTFTIKGEYVILKSESLTHNTIIWPS